MQNKKMYLFDADGTLWDRDTRKLLPNSLERAGASAFKGQVVRRVICTNQGAVGLRYWYDVGGFGDPSTLPTAAQSWQRYGQLASDLGFHAVYMAFAYRSKTSGLWGPTPVDDQSYIPGEWRRDWRKPGAGMLLQAMRDAGVTPAETIFIGDNLDVDLPAAAAAGVDFIHSDEFFGRLPAYQ